MRVVDPRGEMSRDTATLLRRLADEADAGHVVAFTCLTEYADGRYTTHGNGTMSRLQTAGALFEAAIKRLGLFDAD